MTNATNLYDKTAPLIPASSPRRAKPIPREAWRQEHAVKFIEAAITCPHTVMAFDRSMARGDWSHRFEARRGVRAGTPDMLIIALNGMAHHHIWIEWKADGNKPNDNQIQSLALLASLGDVAKWCVRIEDLCHILTNCGLPMTPGAQLMAMRMDALVDGRIAKEEAKRDGATPRKAARARKAPPRYSAGKRMIKRAAKAGIVF